MTPTYPSHHPPRCPQWSTYGYIPSALPDSNCFGEGSARGSFPTTQAATSTTTQLASAPSLLPAVSSSKVPLLLLCAAAPRVTRAQLRA